MNTSLFDPAHAWANLTELCANPYPGRGVTIGTARTSPFANPAHVLLTFIGGRSPGSKNRKYVYNPKNKAVTTTFVDEELGKKTDPALIIYPAMLVGNADYDFIASNGHQTKGIHDGLNNETGHAVAIEQWVYEPDAPNFTNRISGSLELINGRAPRIVMSTISKAPEGDYLGDYEHNDVVRSCWQLPSALGIGYLLHTYACDGNPIPPYLGTPKAIPLEGAPSEMLTTIWDSLNAETRVAIALRVVDGVTNECMTLIKNGTGDIETFV